MHFVDVAAAALSLQNVSTVWGRCEELGHDRALREQFDVVTARAVAETSVLAEFCLPFVRIGGLWVAAKGATVEVCCCFSFALVSTVSPKMAFVKLYSMVFLCCVAVCRCITHMWREGNLLARWLAHALCARVRSP